MKKGVVAGVAICVMGFTFTVRATQAGATHYISGQQSDFSTLAPTKSGLYFGNFFLDYNDATFNDSKGLPFGRLIALNATVNVQAEVPLVIYAYPFDFLGGTLSSGFDVPYEWVNVKADGTLHNDRTARTGAIEERTAGVGDMELMPLMAAWTNGDFQFDGMLNIWAPTGGYETAIERHRCPRRHIPGVLQRKLPIDSKA